jgi:hypothetical protein
MIELSHLATQSCLHSHSARARVEFLHRRSTKPDPQEEMFRVVVQVDLVTAMLRVSPSPRQADLTPLYTASTAQLFSLKICHKMKMRWKMSF